MSAQFLIQKHINLIVHRMKYFLIDRAHVNNAQVISFTVYFWFFSMGAAAMVLSEIKASSCKGEEAIGVAAMPPPHNPQFENWRFSCFIPVCDGGNFCLAGFSIPNRCDEDKGAQEEVEQKLMSVSAVQCVCSWLEDPMNKSKFLFLSLSFSSPLSCSIALLCSMRIVEGWSYLLAGSVCLRSAGKANAFPDMQEQYSCVVLWPEKRDYFAFQGWVLFRFLFLTQVGLPFYKMDRFQFFSVHYVVCCTNAFRSTVLFSSKMKMACVSVCASCVSSGWTNLAHRRSLAISVHPKHNKFHLHSTALCSYWSIRWQIKFFVQHTKH